METLRATEHLVEAHIVYKLRDVTVSDQENVAFTEAALQLAAQRLGQFEKGKQLKKSTGNFLGELNGEGVTFCIIFSCTSPYILINYFCFL